MYTGLLTKNIKTFKDDLIQVYMSMLNYQLNINISIIHLRYLILKQLHTNFCAKIEPENF